MTELRSFQREFIKRALAPGVDVAGLSIPRGNEVLVPCVTVTPREGFSEDALTLRAAFEELIRIKDETWFHVRCYSVNGPAHQWVEYINAMNRSPRPCSSPAADPAHPLAFLLREVRLGRAGSSPEALMERRAICAGIDAAKAQVDVAVPATPERQREYIRAERSKGVSQRDLAKRLEVSRWTIQQVDR